MGYNPQESGENTINTMVVHVRERGTPFLVPWVVKTFMEPMYFKNILNLHLFYQDTKYCKKPMNTVAWHDSHISHVVISGVSSVACDRVQSLPKDSIQT